MVRRARVEVTCEYLGVELPGRVVLKHGGNYFTVPQEVVSTIWEDDPGLKCQYDRAVRIINAAMYLRTQGEKPPNWTWANFERDAADFLRDNP